MESVVVVVVVVVVVIDRMDVVAVIAVVVLEIAVPHTFEAIPWQLHHQPVAAPCPWEEAASWDSKFSCHPNQFLAANPLHHCPTQTVFPLGVGWATNTVVPRSKWPHRTGFVLADF